MRLGTIAIREALPSSVSNITDKEIQESLWHYYYDVEKSLAYLLSKHTPKQKVAKKENVKGKSNIQGGFISFSFAARRYGVDGERRVEDEGTQGGLSFAFSLLFRVKRSS
jgi:HBS1 N-terminus